MGVWKKSVCVFSFFSFFFCIFVVEIYRTVCSVIDVCTVFVDKYVRLGGIV